VHLEQLLSPSIAAVNQAYVLGEVALIDSLLEKEAQRLSEERGVSRRCGNTILRETTVSRSLDTQGFEWLGQPLKGPF